MSNWSKQLLSGGTFSARTCYPIFIVFKTPLAHSFADFGWTQIALEMVKDFYDFDAALKGLIELVEVNLNTAISNNEVRNSSLFETLA